MILAKKRTEEYENTVTNIAAYLEKKGYEHIRAQAVDNYEDPAILIRKGEEEGFKPDLTARKNGGKNYFEIVDYSGKDKNLIISKWMLLSSLAGNYKGELFLVVPRGKMNYTNTIIKNHAIQANVLSIKDL